MLRFFAVCRLAMSPDLFFEMTSSLHRIELAQPDKET